MHQRERICNFRDGIRYKGKEGFLQFLEENLEYDPASNDMIYKHDLHAALGAYCIKNNLQKASPIRIGHHLGGLGVKVKRYGATFHQRYCYVGFQWKIPDFETIKPQKPGRKRLDITERDTKPAAKPESKRKSKRKAKEIAAEETEKIIEVASENERDLSSLCTIDVTPCAMQMNDQGPKLIKRTQEERAEELSLHVMEEGKFGGGTSYRGKEAFLLFLEENLEYNRASNDMIYRNDLLAALGAYCAKNHLVEASPVCIGHHLRGVGVQVKRSGTAFYQRYCYVGFKWKIPGFETIKPAKRGRKKLDKAKRRLAENLQDIIEITIENEKDFLSMCTGDIAQYALHSDGQKLQLVKRPLADRMKELKHLITTGKPGWWNNPSASGT
ncbi:uncharacterized protein [Panulirus ornatus]|uniref:uncharacterized protein n=1 Tax=Panulirus ornatus TaxID=150431 RepID=UPI003A897D95